MKAAIVLAAGQTPVFGDFAEPVAAAGEQRIAVTAAAVHQIVKARAAGAHYSAGGGFPFVVGIDGVGRLEDGSRVYFLLPKAPFGSMAEIAVVPEARCVLVPDGIDDATAAALANPGMSSWAALRERAQFQPGETVLVNGATGASGRLAVQVARHLGAGRIIATGRNPASLAELAALGADETIQLDEDAVDERCRDAFATGIDVVLDYLWGPSAERIIRAATRAGNHARRIRFVQIGSLTGAEIPISGAGLRSTPIELLGSGIGSVPLERFCACIGALFQAAGPGGFRIATRPVALADVERAWTEDDSTRRTVFLVDGQGASGQAASQLAAV